MVWTDQELRKLSASIITKIESEGFCILIPGSKKYKLSNLPNIKIKHFTKVEDILKDKITLVFPVSITNQKAEENNRQIDVIFCTNKEPEKLFAYFDTWIVDAHKKAAKNDAVDFINFTSRIRALLKTQLENQFNIKLVSKVLH